MQQVQPQESSNRSFSWRQAVARYQNPDARRSWAQVANTLIPYAIIWVLAYYALTISWWLALPLTILGGLFLLRTFIIFHDCGHNNFFESKRLNEIVGTVTGALVFTPYFQWRHNHALHHASAGDLDRRGVGDVWTMTVDEYLAADWKSRLGYRLYRNMFFMLVIGPLFVFLIGQRIPSKSSRGRERNSVYWLNLILLLVVVAAALTIGLRAFILIQLPMIWIAGSVGIWMFYVQHQFEGVYWERHGEWDYVQAALAGSSFYKLPKWLQWFSGSIGFHHIHHLSPRIPNYNLEQCHNENEPFRQIKPITFIESLKSLSFRVWDEQSNQLISFRQLRARQRANTQTSTL